MLVYKRCNLGQSNKLNVHNVPHTHNDVSWLKTIDQYYYARNNIQHILDSVIQALTENPDRRFIYVEIAFFWRSWRQPSGEVQNTVRQLVNEGEYLEIFILRAEILRDQFDHSKQVASLFAYMSFDGLFSGRLDLQDFSHRYLTQTMEMIWNGSANIGVTFRTYCPPESFCFDVFCQDEPIKAMAYATNHIMMTIGDDFQYENAYEWYKNLDKLIKYSDINVFYSTPTVFTLAIWNPMIQSLDYMVRVPVTDKYTVRSPTGSFITADFVPILTLIKNIPGRTSSAQYEAEKEKDSSMETTHNVACIIQNQHLTAEFDNQRNPQNITNRLRRFSIQFSVQGFYWYQSFQENNCSPEFQSSGAYYFRPFTSNPLPITRVISFKTCSYTSQVQTVLIVYNEWASQEVRIYAQLQIVEIEWIVGLIPIADNLGKEIIMRYNTDIKSNERFYTDANGREVLERKRDYRPSYNYTIYESVNNERQLKILTDRSQGGSSIHDGSIELMIHRHTLYDDNLGVGEPHNETAYCQGLVICGKHILIIEPPEKSVEHHHPITQTRFMSPFSTYALPNLSYTNYSLNYHHTCSALMKSLPYNIHLLTFD
ncbi:hypothetical protein I4U23_004741 [Adineta vaga]|nr:hypothetical protein I4U23_004741 [Adineta vaga]